VQHFLDGRLIAIPAGSGISELRTEYERSLWFLLAIAGLVLLTACANLANLLLARANARRGEIAVRQALGASRARLITQLLIESLVVALIGAALGAGVAQTLSRILVAFLSTQKDQVFLDLSMDWRVVGFAAALAVLTCLLFGLAPAVRATRTEPTAVMNGGGRGMTAGRERLGMRRALVVMQVSLSLVLVAGALLFSRSLGKLMTVDMGFRPEQVLIADVVFRRLPAERYAAFKEELLGRIRAIPGVEAAAIAHEVPLRGFGGANIRMDGTDPAQAMATKVSRVGPGYFATLQIPMLAGRDFHAADRATAPKVAIVNQAFAQRFLSGANPVGRRFLVATMADLPETSYEIVGLVRDTKYGDLREEALPIAYTSPAQDPRSGPGGNVLIRSVLAQAETVAAVKRVLHEISPAITVSFQGFKPMIEATIRREQLMATLSGFFGLLALLLAWIGLYGVVSYNVASRTGEIGIRMALGAGAGDVSWLILRETLWLVIAGVALGMPMVLVVTRLASTLLFGLTPADPVSLVVAVLSLFAVGMLAGYLPARRAARADPMAALRRE
jgi:predicted permease